MNLTKKQLESSIDKCLKRYVEARKMWNSPYAFTVGKYINMADKYAYELQYYDKREEERRYRYNQRIKKAIEAYASSVASKGTSSKK